MDQAADAGRTFEPIQLSAADQQKLLKMARDAISSALLGVHFPELRNCSSPLNQVAGIFVTLRCRLANELHLRGCIGQVQAEEPLYKSVPALAIKAARHDPRFPPLAQEELPSLHISISILSPLKKLADPEAFEIGSHGLLIEGYGRRGLLLPEVPLARDWGKQEFLQALCRKAGLPSNSWRDRRVKLFSFTTLEFEES